LALCVLALGAAPVAQAEGVATATASSPSQALSIADARAYAAAFAAVRRGEFEAADIAVEAVRDPCLIGRLTFEKLTHPTYGATYAQLRQWLEQYGRQPEAERVFALARRKQTAQDPPLPNLELGSSAAEWSRIERAARRYEERSAAPAQPSARMLEARTAYFAGDLSRAASLAASSGDRWTAGLTAFRQKRFSEALTDFSALASDATKDDWTRSAGAFWSARAAVAAGQAERAPGFLRIAASTPFTFYGLIAERELGLDPAVGPGGIDPLAGRNSLDQAHSPTLISDAALQGLTATDPRAHRAAALAQIGLRVEAGQEVRMALEAASEDADQKTWRGLGLALNLPLASHVDTVRRRPGFDFSAYQTPGFAPRGGYSVDRALIFAIVKHESRFQPAAQGSNAYGLMQLTPMTAVKLSGDSSFARNPAPLKDPSINLQLGQTYVKQLLHSLQGDLLHTLASYNLGPQPVQAHVQELKGNDSLMIMESMPGASTRQFVQKVMANYWIYRQIFGQPARSLDDAASAGRIVRASLDFKF
jgi:soluble lytic murein transglycosylase-like protein